MKRRGELPPTWLVGRKTRLRAFETGDVPLLKRCRLAIDKGARAFVVQTLAGRDIGVLAVLISGPHAAVAIGFTDAVRFGDGSAEDALRVICEGLPRVARVERIEALVAASNGRSVDAHRRAGFQPEGVLREALAEGKAYRDAVMLSVLVDG